MDTPSHADIMERIDTLEAKVDDLLKIVQQANGAWSLLKVIGSITIGFAAVWTALQHWWLR